MFCKAVRKEPVCLHLTATDSSKEVVKIGHSLEFIVSYTSTSKCASGCTIFLNQTALNVLRD